MLVRHPFAMHPRDVERLTVAEFRMMCDIAEEMSRQK